MASLPLDPTLVNIVENDDPSQLEYLLELALYDEGLASTADIIGLEHCFRLERLNLHSNRIYELHGLTHLAMLRELNLSSNRIEQLSGLEGLHSLEVLDLACNRLTGLSSLESLHRLRRLVLSYNRISSLDGLNQMRGAEYALESVDLKDNQLHRLEELVELCGLEHLHEQLQ